MIPKVVQAWRCEGIGDNLRIQNVELTLDAQPQVDWTGVRGNAALRWWAGGATDLWVRVLGIGCRLRFEG